MSIHGIVGIRTNMPLDELATILSKQVCGGIEFGGKNRGLRDEIPAVVTLEPFLGLRLVLWGDAGDYGLSLEMWHPQGNADGGADSPIIDLSQLLFDLLVTIEGVVPVL